MSDRGRQDGFTLIELLVALAVFSIVIAVLYGTFFASNRAVAEVDARMLSLHEARMALDVMGREVESTLRSGNGATIVLRDRDFFGRQASEFSMDTFASPLPGAARASYMVAEDKDGRLVLLKGLAPAWQKGSYGNETPVLEDLGSFTVEAWDGKRWLRTWADDTASPEAVRITLEVGIGGDRSIKLTETVRA